MSTPAPRRPAFQAIEIPLPKGVTIQRLEQFRTKRRWWQIWRPKYSSKIYALTEHAVYDVTEYLELPR